MRDVLVIEDDHYIVELVSIHLTDMDCTVKVELDGRSGLNEALNGDYDLIVLDVMLPSMDGLDVCRRLRAEKINTPILMLTAKSEEIDKVLGLETGADDYITKPFSIREFSARVKAIFRRSEMNDEKDVDGEEEVIQVENLLIDVNRHKVLLSNKQVELTRKEFDLLLLMAKNPGRVYSRIDLLNQVWGYNYDGYEHTVNSHINRLRSKIETDLNNPEYILTSWGVGYKFNDAL